MSVGRGMHAIKLLLLLMIACMQETEPASQELGGQFDELTSHLYLARKEVHVIPQKEDSIVKAKITAIKLAKRKGFGDEVPLNSGEPRHDNSPLEFKLIKFEFTFGNKKYTCTLENKKLSHAIEFVRSKTNVCTPETLEEAPVAEDAGTDDTPFKQCEQHLEHNKDMKKRNGTIVMKIYEYKNNDRIEVLVGYPNPLTTSEHIHLNQRTEYNYSDTVKFMNEANISCRNDGESIRFIPRKDNRDIKVELLETEERIKVHIGVGSKNDNDVLFLTAENHLEGSDSRINNYFYINPDGTIYSDAIASKGSSEKTFIVPRQPQ